MRHEKRNMPHNGGGMLRAALGTASLSAVTNLIETAKLSSYSSPPTGIYRMLCPEILYFYQTASILSAWRESEDFDIESIEVSLLSAMRYFLDKRGFQAVRNNLHERRGT